MARQLTEQEMLEYEQLENDLAEMRSKERSKSAEEVAGGLGHTFLSSVARGPTLNYPLLESALTGKSLDELNKEIIAQHEANPKTAFAGELLGGVLTPIPGAGFTKLGGSVGGAIVRGGLKGSAIGGAMGLLGNQPDPSKNNLVDRLKSAGMGAVVGGVMGAGFGGIGQKVSNVRATKAAMQQAEREAADLEALIAKQRQEAPQVEAPQMPADMPPIPADAPGGQPIASATKPKLLQPGESVIGGVYAPETTQPSKMPTIYEAVRSGREPKTYGDLVVKNAKQKGMQFGEGELLPREAELVDALAVLGPELENKPLPIHLERVGGTERAKSIKRMTEMPGDVSKAISEADAILKAELHGKARGIVKGMGASSDEAATETIDVLNKFHDNYLKTRDRLSPQFEAVKDMTSVSGEIAEDLARRVGDISEKYTGSNLVDVSYIPEKGIVNVEMKPFRSLTGVDRHEYDLFKPVVNDIQFAIERSAGQLKGKGDLSVGEIGRMRDFIRKNIDTSRPRDIKLISELRDEMLKKMDVIANETGGPVRDIMKQWAINERANDVVENILGGSIKARLGATGKNAIAPEKVAQKILQDSEATRLMKEAIGEEGIRRITGAALAETMSQKQNATGFSGAMLKKWLDRNKASLKDIMTPDELERIRAVSTIARLVSDQPPANTSGTATSLMDVAKSAFKEGPIKGPQKALEEYFANEAQKDRFNQMLQELSAKWGPVVNKATKTRLERRQKLLKKDE